MTLDDLRERLAGFSLTTLDAELYRVTPIGQDPLAASTRGGRWMPPGEHAVLYTSVERDGALAERSFHFGLLTPLPSKPVLVHR